MELYQYYQDYGRMGAIEGLFFATQEEIGKYSKASLCWDELLGKYSEGCYEFSDETLTRVNIPQSVVILLYEQLGKVVSGPFDFDYFDEQIAEQEEDSEGEH